MTLLEKIIYDSAAQPEQAINAAERLSNETSMTSEKSSDTVSIITPFVDSKEQDEGQIIMPF